MGKARRMVKQTVLRGCSEVRDAKKNERHVCGRARVGERRCLRGSTYSEPYVEPLRFTTRGIPRVTFVNAAESVRQLSLARTTPADIFSIR